jgi:hypothetical protein
MTVKYEYKCNVCEKQYVEQRGAEEAQFFTDCAKSDGGTYELINETVLAPNIEVVSSPVTETAETPEDPV